MSASVAQRGDTGQASKVKLSTNLKIRWWRPRLRRGELPTLRSMRRNSRQALAGAATVAAVVAMFGTACSSTESNKQQPSATSSAPTSTSELPALPAEPTHEGTAGVSPGGVTTAVDVPSDATESQYGQACHAAKLWMDAQGGDPATLIEPYLKVLQAPDFSDPGNFNTPWAQLTPAQQAGVIMAVNGAANGDCG